MREVLIAKDGNVFTDGEIFGKKIYLALGGDKTRYYEISIEEYEKIQESLQTEKI